MNGYSGRPTSREGDLEIRANLANAISHSAFRLPHVGLVACLDPPPLAPIRAFYDRLTGTLNAISPT